jgi:hypothetical protein
MKGLRLALVCFIIPTLLFFYYANITILLLTSEDREDLVQVWQLLEVITNPLVHKPYDESESIYDIQ